MARIVDIDASGSLVTISGESQVTLLDAEGSEITNADSISAGSEISIVNSIKNLQRTSQSYSYILVVFDSAGVVVQLQQVRTGTLEQGQTVKITTDWTAPVQKSEYSFKIFVIDDSTYPASLLLKNSISTKVGVI
ncbi:MAG: hypothetical protein ACREAW_02935 [Nitrososphaera sp.]